MVPDRNFVKELQILDPALVAVWHPRLHRWQIRQWILPRGRKDHLDYYEWRKKAMLIRTVCYRDEEYHDIGYHPLDQRTLYALKLSRELSIHPEKTARAVDEANKKVEAEWAAENADLAREVAKSIYHHYREPSVDLGGRSRY